MTLEKPGPCCGATATDASGRDRVAFEAWQHDQMDTDIARIRATIDRTAAARG